METQLELAGSGKKIAFDQDFSNLWSKFQTCAATGIFLIYHKIEKNIKITDQKCMSAKCTYFTSSYVKKEYISEKGTVK